MIDSEIETKILEQKSSNFKDLIIDLGGEACPPQLIMTRVYKHPEKEDYVRVREIEEDDIGSFVRYQDIELTIKKSISSDGSVKVYEENTIKINDRYSEHIIAALDALGVPCRCSTKIRRKFLLKNCVLDFDHELEVEIPEFLEIEGEVKSILMVLEKLKIPKEAMTDFTSDDLYAHYGVSLPEKFCAERPNRG